MTRITFYKRKDQYLGFEVSGHTGKDDYGKDLLCAQISTVSQLAIVGAEQLKIPYFHEVSDGYLKIIIENSLNFQKEVQFLFNTCLQSFKSIIIGEEKFAKLEVKNV